MLHISSYKKAMMIRNWSKHERKHMFYFKFETKIHPPRTLQLCSNAYAFVWGQIQVIFALYNGSWGLLPKYVPYLQRQMFKGALSSPSPLLISIQLHLVHGCKAGKRSWNSSRCCRQQVSTRVPEEDASL